MSVSEQLLQIKVFHICEHCNKEFELPNEYSSDMEFFSTIPCCSNCGKRNDTWIKIKRVKV